tara:strand:+ start:716 stop:874 length:159 start_codon:yes stop_codon:yes gene_type:complete
MSFNSLKNNFLRDIIKMSFSLKPSHQKTDQFSGPRAKELGRKKAAGDPFADF